MRQRIVSEPLLILHYPRFCVWCVRVVRVLIVDNAWKCGRRDLAVLALRSLPFELFAVIVLHSPSPSLIFVANFECKHLLREFTRR